MAGPEDSRLSSSEDVARVRRVLARELETINEYEAFAHASSDARLQAFFQHLATEEKEHVAEAIRMLEILDAGQAAHLAKPLVPGHFEGKAPAPSSSPSSPPMPAAAPAPHPMEPTHPLPAQRILYGLQAPPSQLAGSLTVGALKRGGR